MDQNRGVLRGIAWFVLMGTLLGSGCGTARHEHRLSWRTLSRGLTSGITDERRIIIRDEASYLKLWAEHAADMNRVALPPVVDFTWEMVLFVGIGNRPTGGYFIEVVDVFLDDGRLRVLLNERTPEEGSVQMQVITQPYQFIALPSVHAPVRFRTVERLSQENRRIRTRARPGEAGATERSPER